MSTKRKAPAKLAQPAIKPSAKALPKQNLDESKAAVFGGGHAVKRNALKLQAGEKEIVTISSDSSSAEEDGEEEEDEEDEEEEDPEEESRHTADLTNGDVTMDDAADADEHIPEDEEVGEPSFGDLVKTNADPIDVSAFDPSSQNLSLSRRIQLQPPSGASLGTVLTQALKTNDIASLETCLHTTDLNTIRATIQRLDSPLAGILLHKLAERLHRRPGRAGSLMVWVQWTLVTHGGYLATQPDLIKRLAELNRVIDERSRSLQSLLSLKGKLDMLEAQLSLRRSMLDQRRRVDDEEDDEGIIYVEGQDSEDEAAEVALNGDLSDMESDMSEDMPMTNGVTAEEEDSEEEDSDDDDDLIDDEAEETDNDEDDVDHDDLDSESGEESDDEVQVLRPSKMQRLGGSSSRKH